MAVQVDDTTWEVQGRKVTLPVEVRDASMASATFLVPTDPVRRLLPPMLEPVGALGRALLALVFVDYRDGDLGTYHEVGVCFVVRGPAPDRRPGAFIHRLPVDGEFTMEAGRDLWGFPKWMTSSDIEFGQRAATCHLQEGNDHVLTMSVRPLPVALPGSRTMTMDAWTVHEGVVRRTPWTMTHRGVRPRPGGTTVVLGDRHPMATELRSLGLPRRAVFSTVVDHVTGSFAAATEVSERAGQAPR